MFWQLLLIAVAFLIVYLRWQSRRIRKLCTEIRPGELQALPIIGHAHLLLGDHEGKKTLIFG